MNNLAFKVQSTIGREDLDLLIKYEREYAASSYSEKACRFCDVLLRSKPEIRSRCLNCGVFRRRYL